MIKNAEDIRDGSSVPGLRRSPGGGHDNPLQYSCLENPMDRRALWATIQGHKDPLEEDMTTHSSVLAWRIPLTEEPGGLQSIGFQTVGHD